MKELLRVLQLEFDGVSAVEIYDAYLNNTSWKTAIQIEEENWTPREMILNSFDWATSPEGYAYWEDVAEEF